MLRGGGFSITSFKVIKLSEYNFGFRLPKAFLVDSFKILE